MFDFLTEAMRGGPKVEAERLFSAIGWHVGWLWLALPALTLGLLAGVALIQGAGGGVACWVFVCLGCVGLLRAIISTSAILGAVPTIAGRGMTLERQP